MGLERRDVQQFDRADERPVEVDEPVGGVVGGCGVFTAKKVVVGWLAVSGGFEGRQLLLPRRGARLGRRRVGLVAAEGIAIVRLLNGIGVRAPSRVRSRGDRLTGVVDDRIAGGRAHLLHIDVIDGDVGVVVPAAGRVGLVRQVRVGQPLQQDRRRRGDGSRTGVGVLNGVRHVIGRDGGCVCNCVCVARRLAVESGGSCGPMTRKPWLAVRGGVLLGAVPTGVTFWTPAPIIDDGQHLAAGGGGVVRSRGGVGLRGEGRAGRGGTVGIAGEVGGVAQALVRAGDDQLIKRGWRRSPACVVVP